MILAFTKNEISNELFEKLTLFEKQLLTLLIQRKFELENDKPESDKTGVMSRNELQEHLNTYRPKKTEECYKFIFSRSFNFIKSSIEKSAGLRMSFEDFYEHYFKETSERLNLPIREFRYPLTKELKGKINLNYNYFQKVFQNEKFISDINDYFEAEIISQHNKEIIKKLTLLLLKWEQMYFQWKLRKDVPFSTLMAHIYQHKRYKIPWTIEELKESILKFKKLIQLCREKREKLKKTIKSGL